MEHVKQLMASIESNGGVIDPLIVKNGNYEVFDGNSRLAALRLLSEKNPVKYGKVKCKILPKNIPDDAIFALLGQYHIIGRKDWDPFEQASYLYRRSKETKLSIEYIAKELGLTKSKAEKMIEVVEVMTKNNDVDKHHYSHYEEYLKSPSIKKYRDTSADLDKVIFHSIKKNEIPEARDIRKLGEIARVNDNQAKRMIQKIADTDLTIEEAYDRFQDTGKLDNVVKKLKSFREYINDETFEGKVSASEDKAMFEIKKIIRDLIKIREKFE